MTRDRFGNLELTEDGKVEYAPYYVADLKVVKVYHGETVVYEESD